MIPPLSVLTAKGREFLNFYGPCGFYLLFPLYPLGFPGGSGDKESICNAGDLGSIPGLGRSPGEGNGYPLQYSRLENSRDRGSWQATAHGVTKSRAQLNNFHSLTHSLTYTHCLFTCMDGSRDILDIYMMNYCVKVV